VPTGSPQAAGEADSCFPSAKDPLGPLETYKDTYLLPYAYDEIGSPDRMHEEVKFQISIHKEIFRCAPFHLYFGYTQLSLWEFYRGSNEKFFRASDYNPELYFVIDRLKFLGDFQAGLEHQSNGTGGVQERSWNRVYIQPHWQNQDATFGASLKLWYRLYDGPPATPSNPGGDNNPDIEDYLGIFELRPWWTFGPYHRLSAMYRRGYKDGTDTVELDYDVTVGYPGSGIKARVQVFSGYGETLIDYRRQVNRYSIGFLFQ
jgi:phospholipase A1/A2